MLEPETNDYLVALTAEKAGLRTCAVMEWVKKLKVPAEKLYEINRDMHNDFAGSTQDLLIAVVNNKPYKLL